MRLAVLIIGLLLGLLMFFQTFIVYALSGLGDDETNTGAAAVGIAMALLWLAACAFVLPFPMVSVLLFGLAALFGFMAGLTSDFVDLTIWGGMSAGLAFLSFLGWMGKRKARREIRAERQHQIERDERLEELLRQQRRPVRHTENMLAAATVSPRATFPNFCPSCKHRSDPGAKFCADCGTTLPQTSVAAT